MLHFFSATCCKKSWGFNDYLPSSSVTHIQTSLPDDFIPAKSGSTLMSAYDPGGMLGTSLKWEGQGFGIAIPGMQEIQSDQLKIQVSSTTRFGWRANFRHWLNHPLIPFTLTFSRSLSGTGRRTPKVLERHLQGPAVFLKRMWRYFQGQQDINNIQHKLSQKPRYEPSWYPLVI